MRLPLFRLLAYRKEELIIAHLRPPDRDKKLSEFLGFELGLPPLSFFSQFSENQRLSDYGDRIYLHRNFLVHNLR